MDFAQTLANFNTEQYLNELKTSFEYYSVYLTEQFIQHINTLEDFYKKYLQDDVTYGMGLLEIYWLYIILIIIIFYLVYTMYGVKENYSISRREKDEYHRKYIETCERLEKMVESNRVNIRQENRNLKYRISILEKENSKIPEMQSRILNLKKDIVEKDSHIDVLEIQKEKHIALLKYPSFIEMRNQLNFALVKIQSLKNELNDAEKEKTTLQSKIERLSTLKAIAEKSLNTYRGFRTNTKGYFILKGDSSSREFRGEMRDIDARYLGRNEYLVSLEYFKNYEDKNKN